MDVEPRAIDGLKRRANKAGLQDRIHASVCRPRDLGLDAFGGEVDLIAVIHALHELEDVPGFLGQAAALLKPTGRMLVVEPKGHVTPDKFAAEMESCRLAGFQELTSPATGPKRRTALLSPPAR